MTARCRTFSRASEDTTFGIFERHNIKIVGFWTKKDVNELVYVCEYESEEAVGAAWDAFRADPDWIKAKAETEADGPIVSEVISKMLSPTSFSPIK
ncbi:TPA: NIPSNAP family protein [Candidatus Latescibacteria bacterium]|nr:NIPSNAP family protein [Candidatus Latescibacterota bacterium]